jgi:hypothetical protein
VRVQKKIDAPHSTEKVVNGSRHSTCLVGKKLTCRLLRVSLHSNGTGDFLECVLLFICAQHTIFAPSYERLLCGETYDYSNRMQLNLLDEKVSRARFCMRVSAAWREAAFLAKSCLNNFILIAPDKNPNKTNEELEN